MSQIASGMGDPFGERGGHDYMGNGEAQRLTKDAGLSENPGAALQRGTSVRQKDGRVGKVAATVEAPLRNDVPVVFSNGAQICRMSDLEIIL